MTNSQKPDLFFSFWCFVYMLLSLTGLPFLDPLFCLWFMFLGHLAAMFIRTIVCKKKLTIERFVIGNVLHAWCIILPAVKVDINQSGTYLVPALNLLVLVLLYLLFLYSQNINPITIYRDAPTDLRLYRSLWPFPD